MPTAAWTAWGGWEDQQTVLDMPGGSYVVCAASVPAARVATGYYDAGPDGFGGHMSITVTEPDPDPDTSPEFWPNEGDLSYNGGANAVEYAESDFVWRDPVGWQTDDPGYEHDLVLEPAYVSDCTSFTDMPQDYDDCSTAGWFDADTQHAFAFGTYNSYLLDVDTVTGIGADGNSLGGDRRDQHAFTRSRNNIGILVRGQHEHQMV